jgi:hypothetical protein
VTVETADFLAGNVAGAAVGGLLVYRRAWRTLPCFCIYSLELLAGSLFIHAMEHWFSARASFTAYFYENILNCILQFCVLVEIAWSVFRPFHKSLPRGTAVILGILIAAIGVVVWPFVPAPAIHSSMATQWNFTMRLQETVSILRVLFFLVLAAFSQLLSIGWRDRELQVATGLGFYSFVSLSITVWHAHQTTSQQYVALEGLLAAAYVCSLLYWVYSFAQKEAERRDFSPQMQGMLLAVAGAARLTRVALADSTSMPFGKKGRE